jgi:hypothetical protein
VSAEEFIPLLSPKPFREYSPEEYLTYVRSLYREPERKAPPAEFSVSLNAKGTPTIRIRRTPKYLTAEEVGAAAAEIGWPLQKFWLNCVKKKIEIRTPQPARRGRK